MKGVDTTLSVDHLKEKIISNKKVLSVRRINRKQTVDGVVKYIPRQMIVIKFLGHTLPDNIVIHNVFCRVDPYVQNVTICHRCFRFGHSLKACKAKPRCKNCGNENHTLELCPLETPICVNCKNNHFPDNRDCPSFQKQTLIKKKMAYDNMTYEDAFKCFQQPSYASSASKNIFATTVAPSGSTSTSQHKNNINEKKNYKFTQTLQPRPRQPEQNYTPFSLNSSQNLMPPQPIGVNPFRPAGLNAEDIVDNLIKLVSGLIPNISRSHPNINIRESLLNIITLLSNSNLSDHNASHSQS